MLTMLTMRGREKARWPLTPLVGQKWSGRSASSWNTLPNREMETRGTSTPWTRERTPSAEILTRSGRRVTPSKRTSGKTAAPSLKVAESFRLENIVSEVVRNS